MTLRLRRSLPALLGCVLLSPFSGVAQAPNPDSPAIEAQAHALVARLTLEQKIKMLGGNGGTADLPSIGLPHFKMSDGPVGVRVWGPTTVFPAGVGLAATWDPEQARREGEALGRDARARNVNFLLGPGVNIARSPISGRSFTSPTRPQDLSGPSANSKAFAKFVSPQAKRSM